MTSAPMAASGKAPGQLGDHREVLGGGVWPVHAAKNGVAAALQGQMEVARHPVAGGFDDGHERPVDLQWLDGAQPVAADGVRRRPGCTAGAVVLGTAAFQQGFQQVGQRSLRRCRVPSFPG